MVKNTDGKLEIVKTGNAETPVSGDKAPLTCCDVWEHAYYVDYRNARPKYLDAFLESGKLGLRERKPCKVTQTLE